jgi:hypothetical protein
LYKTRRRRHTHHSIYSCLRPNQRLALSLLGVSIAATISIIAATTGTNAPVEETISRKLPQEAITSTFVEQEESIEVVSWGQIEVKGESVTIPPTEPPKVVSWGQIEVKGESVTIPPTEPPKVVQVFDIALSEELQVYTYETAVKYGIEDHYPLVLALMWVESRYKVSSISKSSDYGIMQINKCNHSWLRDELGITDFLDPEQNIEAGIRMLSEYLLTYSTEHKALMAYNMGVGGANKEWNKGNYTSSYSRKVMAALDQLLTTNTIKEG